MTVVDGIGVWLRVLPWAVLRVLARFSCVGRMDQLRLSSHCTAGGASLLFCRHYAWDPFMLREGGVCVCGWVSVRLRFWDGRWGVLRLGWAAG